MQSLTTYQERTKIGRMAQLRYLLARNIVSSLNLFIEGKHFQAWSSVDLKIYLKNQNTRLIKSNE